MAVYTQIGTYFEIFKSSEVMNHVMIDFIFTDVSGKGSVWDEIDDSDINQIFDIEVPRRGADTIMISTLQSNMIKKKILSLGFAIMRRGEKGEPTALSTKFTVYIDEDLKVYQGYIS